MRNNKADFRKNIFRQKIQEQRDSLDKEEREARSRVIVEKLLKLDEYILAENIFTYYPFRSEVNTIPVITSALKNGKNILLPKVENDYLDLYYIRNLTKDIVAGFCGIREPNKGSCVKAMVDSVDLMIVPGICFDFKMNRMGYGGGFYDKIIGKIPKKVKKVALAFDFQVLDEIPVNNFDGKMNLIITESKIYSSD